MNKYLRKITPQFIKRAYHKIRPTTSPAKTILIAGWLGAFNLGDEMMLDVTLKSLKAQWPNCVITLLVHNINTEVMQRYRDYKVVVRRSISEATIEQLAHDNDIFWINGGALLDDRDYGAAIVSDCGIKNEMTLAFDLARVAKAFFARHKKVFCYGLSTNRDIANPQFKRDYRELVDKSVHFSMRDTFSRNKFAQFADDTKIQLVDDLEFADAAISKVSTAPPSDTIAIIPVLFNELMDGFEAFIKLLIETTDYNIKLILFYDEFDNDINLAFQLRQRLGDNSYRVNEIVVPRNSDELKNNLADVNAVFSMRYHGTLFAGAIGKPTVCINWDKHPHYYNKNKYLREHYGLVLSAINFSRFDKLNRSKIVKILANLDAASPTRLKKIYRVAKHNLAKVIKKI